MAHEQAVINGADREYFARLLYETVSSERLPAPTSQKARSKRTSLRVSRERGITDQDREEHRWRGMATR